MQLSAGDRVALLVPGSAAYVELVLALLRRGVFPIPLDPRLTDAERRPLFADLEPHLVVTDPADVPALLDELGPGDGVRRSAARSTSRAVPPAARRASAPDSWTRTAADRAGARGARPVGVRRRRRQPGAEPLHHSAPLRFALGTPLAGGRVVAPGPFDPAIVTAAIAEHRPTTMFCVPAHLQRLFAHWDRVGVPDLSSYRLVAHAGAPCPPAVKERLVELFPAGSTWEFYGSTEGQFTACRSEEEAVRPGTVGRARPGRTISVDDDGVLWCVVPEHARFSYLQRAGEDRGGLARDGRRTGVHGRGHRPHRRRRLRVPRRPPRGPGDLRRCQRLPDRGGERAPRGRRSDRRRGVRRRRRQLGAAGVRGVRGHAPTPTRSRHTRGSGLAPPKRPKEYHRVDELPRTATGKLRRLDLPAVVRPRPTSPRG